MANLDSSSGNATCNITRSFLLPGIMSCSLLPAACSPAALVSLALLLHLSFVHTQSLPCNSSTILGFFTAQCDADGNLLPPAHFGSVQAAIDASVMYYARAPLQLPDSHGFPSYVYATFTDGLYLPTSPTIIAGMQDGMGILGYLKYANRTRLTGQGNMTAAIEAARFLGDYLVEYANTKPQGVWANVTRSTGLNLHWPITVSAQYDILFGTNCIETDKVGIAGWALFELWIETQDPRYLQQAIRNARALASTQIQGDGKHSPWPFRVDSVTGEFKSGHKTAAVIYILRLFRALVSRGFPEFENPAANLWSWILKYQIPTADPSLNGTDSLFVNFFEDKESESDSNRNSWSALEVAKFLIEERGSGLDPDWMIHVEDLFHYALTLFGVNPNLGNVTLIGEQDTDHKAWGGANSKLSSVASLFACAGGPTYYKTMGRLNANWMAYFTDGKDGCRSAEAFQVNSTPTRGGWTEDAWLDVLHNMVDSLNAQEGRC